MCTEQIRVRRKREIPVAPYTMEKVECAITTTIDNPEQRKEAIDKINNLLESVMEEKLPFTRRNQLVTAQPPKPTTPPLSTDRYSTLAWKPSTTLSTIELSANPTGLEKELRDKIVAGKGEHYEGRVKYKLSTGKFNGKEYLQRWQPLN